MSSPAERIALARAVLVGAGIPEQDAALDAEVLARHALKWDRATLVAHGREASPAGFDDAFDGLIARRVRREPVAQLVGHREFWGLEFDVTADVLIPRPETELVVEEAVSFAREYPLRRAVDVGTGSGCIAISVAHDIPSVHVTATDCSEAALDVAARNAARHGIAHRLSFVRTDLLDALRGPFDLIVSNPPYIPENELPALPPEVVRFEPHTALFGGGDGLGVIRRLLRDAHSRLAAEGRLIVEFGVHQHEDVRRLAEESGWRVVRIREDLQRIPRAAVLELGIVNCEL